MLIVMRMRRPLAMGFGAFLLVTAVVTIACLSSSPLEVTLDGMETDGFVDDTGATQWLVTLSIRNQGSNLLDFDQRAAKMEARIAERWVRAEPLAARFHTWPPETVRHAPGAPSHYCLPPSPKIFARTL